MTKPKPRCPECRTFFATVQLLAMHRKKAHNVEGTSKSHLANKALKAKRQTKAAAPTVVEIVKTKTNHLSFKCPDCDFTCNKPQLLGRHRRYAHGVVGAVTLLNRQKMEERLRLGTGLHCPHCEFIAASQNGLGVHIAAAHKNLPLTLEGENNIEHSKEKQLARINHNGSTQLVKHEGQTDSDGIAEATLALALGRFQGLCTSMATEFDLPPRRFTRELSRLIYATQVR